MSKPLTVIIPHNLGQAEARRRLESGLEGLTRDLPGVSGVRQAWTGDVLDFSAAVMGQTISGKMEVTADKVRLDLILPGLLGMLAGKITRGIEDRGRLLLR